MKNFKESDKMFDKMSILYSIHFGNKSPELATCKDCLDYRQGLCSGGAGDVLNCMYYKAKGCEFISDI